MYKTSTLSNGVRVVTYDMGKRNSVSIGFWAGVGGRYESDDKKGAAHFLEHVIFKGSKKYSCEEIKRQIEGVGGSLNAFTTEEQTCYYAKIPAQHLNQTFDVLADMVFQPLLAKKDVDKERTVIAEEIKMYHDLPQYHVLELLDALVWPNHPLGKGLAGTIETVLAMTHEDLHRFHEQYYSPANIVVAVCGRLNHEKVVKLTEAKLKKIQGAFKREFVPAVRIQDKPRVNLYHKPTEQMHLILGMQGYDEYDENRYALNLLNTILGGNMSSRLFVEVRENKGLAYSISSFFKTMHDTGLFAVRAGVDNQKLIEAMELIFKELDKIGKHRVGDGEFKRAKEYVLGQIVLGLEDTMDHMLWIGENMIAKNKLETVKEVIRRFEKIKIADIQRVATEILDRRRYNLAVVGPLKEAQEKQLKQMMGVK